MIKLADREKCTGCGACMNSCALECITMKPDQEGFYFPQVDEEKCVQCGKCAQTCPVIHLPIPSKRHDAYAMESKDTQLRFESSSGGLFTLLAEKMLDQGGIVFGAAYQEDFSVAHISIQSKEELGKLRTSKYVQSDTKNTFREVKQWLGTGVKVLYSGTPCQISGLKSYLGHDHENLLCVDLICHGVPSPAVWQSYLNERRAIANGNIVNINVREKSQGWKNFSVLINFDNQHIYYRMHRSDSFIQGFLKDIFLRESCHQCSFKGDFSDADISIGDLWKAREIPDYKDDDTGTSLALIRTQKGSNYFDEIKDVMNYRPIDYEFSTKLNTAIIKSIPKPDGRDEFFQAFAEDDFKFSKSINAIVGPEALRQYFDLLNLWLMKKNAGFSFYKKLKQMNINSIAIGGWGNIGKRFYEELVDTDLTVSYITGCDEKDTGSLILVPMEEISKQKEVDAIIVCSISTFAQMKAKLIAIGNYQGRIISLKDLLM